MRLRQKINIVGEAAKRKGSKGAANALFTGLTLAAEPDYVRSRPIFLQIEPTLNCNLRCRMCRSPHLKRKSETLTLEGFKKVIAQFPYLQKVSLVGAGEPLLNPEIFDIIRFAKSKGLTIGFATNATLLDERITQEVLSSRLDWLNISLDGATKETYEMIRTGADYDTVIKNISNFTAGSNGHLDISVWFLAMKTNLMELPDMVSLVHRLGIKSICVQTMHHWGDPRWKDRLAGESLSGDSGGMQEVLCRTARLAKKKRIRFQYVNIPDKQKPRACQWPWKACYITADGYVTPCCLHGANPQVVSFGNIFDDDFENIWNNSKYREFRQALKSKSNNAPAVCAGCPSYNQKIKI